MIEKGTEVHLAKDFKDPLMMGLKHPSVFQCGKEFVAFDRWTNRDPSTMSQVESLGICEGCWKEAMKTPKSAPEAPPAPQYPEHDKLQKVSEKSQLIGEFLEWLGDHGIHLGTYDKKTGDLNPTHTSTTDLLARFFEIDLKKIEQEKRAMLDEMRRVNSK